MISLRHRFIALALFVFIISSGCLAQRKQNPRYRNPIDSIGFPVYSHQVDTFVRMMEFNYASKMKAIGDSLSSNGGKPWKMSIMPHDDYAYVQYIYPAALKNIKAKIIFIIGVAHKAKLFNIENRIVFDSNEFWNAPYGRIKVSTFRESIMKSMDTSLFVVHDSLQAVEHSVEPFLPVLQYYNKDFEIIPILVPSMSIDRMTEISGHLAKSIYKLAKKENLKWGDDFAIIISNDAVHYGDQDWGDKNYARYGVGKEGYDAATAFDREIISKCLLNGLSIERIRQFANYTVKEENFKEYKWTWCGRYSVPFGMLASMRLEELLEIKLQDKFIAYSTSIDNFTLKTIKGLGVTAPANLRHWVGYACIAYH